MAAHPGQVEGAGLLLDVGHGRPLRRQPPPLKMLKIRSHQQRVEEADSLNLGQTFMCDGGNQESQMKCNMHQCSI